jgi:hypothetical protein
MGSHQPRPDAVRYRDHVHQGKADTVPLLASSSGGFIAISAVIYFVLLVTLGIISIRKGHWVMFIIGIFVPLFWFIGALLPRRVR